MYFFGSYEMRDDSSNLGEHATYRAAVRRYNARTESVLRHGKGTVLVVFLSCSRTVEG